MSVVFDKLLGKPLLHDHTTELDARYVNITGDTMTGQLVLSLAGTGLSVTQDSVIGGYLRVGSTSAPTNTTAGDITGVRLKVGDGAFGTGVEASITGDTAISGFLRVGSETAPTNTTAGDLTVTRLSVGNSSLGATTGEFMNLGGTMTDTTTGSKILFNVAATINSASDPSASAEFRTLNMSAGIANTAINYPTVMGINTESRQSGTGNITQARGIASVGVTLANSSFAGTVTDAIAVLATSVSVSGTPGGTIVTATGVKVGNANMGSSTTAITTQIGVDIVAQTKGATNIGIRIPASSGGGTANYALQLSDTGGTAAGGITFGTDTVLYRDAANSLTTVDKVLITPNSDPTLSLAVSPTVSTSTANARAIETKIIFTGSGDGAGGLGSQPEFRPSSSISASYGFINIAKGNPDTAVTITNLIAGYNRIDTGSLAGAVTNAYGLYIENPSLGSLKPGTIIGLSIRNQGEAGATISVGLDIIAQSASTTNIGARIALAGTYALQLSDTGGTAAGGITFGTDTQLYRSAASTLKTGAAFDANTYKVAGAAGASGTFTTADAKTVTVTSGIITSIV